jgi:hypothetical protein
MATYWGTGRLGSHQSVAYTGTAGVITTAFGTGTQKIRVVLTTAGFIKISSSPTATTSDVYMPADSPEYFTVNPGEKVSAIQLSSNGTLHVTEIA